MKEIDPAAFAEDARGGMDFASLRNKYGTSPSRTKRLMNEALGATEDAVEAEAEAFDITINLPADRVMDLLRGLDAGELLEAFEELEPLQRACILQAVMQKKFDKLLGSKAVQIPILSIGDGAAN